MTLSRRNYKVYADLGLTIAILLRQLTILDMGAGSNFVRADTLPPGWESLMIPGEVTTIADENGRPFRTIGQIQLVVRLGSRTMKCKFVVCERLVAPVIQGCEFNDRFFEAIYPRRTLVELDDGTNVPIVRKPAHRTVDHPTLPFEQDLAQRGAEDGRRENTRVFSRSWAYFGQA